MFRFAASVGCTIFASIALAAAPPSVSNTYPQGHERSPTEREFFAPIQTPTNLAEVATNPKATRSAATASLLSDWLQQFQRPLGLAKGTWLVRR